MAHGCYNIGLSSHNRVQRIVSSIELTRARMLYNSAAYFNFWTGSTLEGGKYSQMSLHFACVYICSNEIITLTINYTYTPLLISQFQSVRLSNVPKSQLCKNVSSAFSDLFFSSVF